MLRSDRPVGNVLICSLKQESPARWGWHDFFGYIRKPAKHKPGCESESKQQPLRCQKQFLAIKWVLWLGVMLCGIASNFCPLSCIGSEHIIATESKLGQELKATGFLNWIVLNWIVLKATHLEYTKSHRTVQVNDGIVWQLSDIPAKLFLQKKIKKLI